MGIESLLTLLLVLAVLAIIWWAVTKMGLPQPFQIVAAVVIAVVAIIVLLEYVPSFGHRGCI